MIILGVTDPAGDDNAAAILVDGELVAMVEEERLNRIKHARAMPPTRAVKWCLEQAGCTMADVDVIAVGHSDPTTAFVGASREIAEALVRRRTPYRSLRDELRVHRMHKSHVANFYPALGIDPDGRDRKKLMWVRHHLAHAASAFFLSPFEHANIISLDGTGGQDAGMVGVGRLAEIEPFEWVGRETSWGVFYELYTGRLGFRRHNDEGKVMGLAAYGDHGGEIFPYIEMNGSDDVPRYDLGDLRSALEAIRPRAAGEYPINDYHEHVAAKLQYNLEQVLARIAQTLHERTGLTDFCLAGGTALNCSANGKLLELPFVERLFVQPAASDCGTALGAAVWAHVAKTGRRPTTTFDHAYWGPEFSNDEIRATLDQAKLSYRTVDDVCAETAKLIADNKIVGWFQGRMEVGPRALGARSILANPADPAMKDAVNNNVKFREPWRPFAPSILADRMEEYFGTSHPSPFMILAFEAREDVRAKIPATLHVDATGRPQSVDRATNERYWRMIDEFRSLTGIPVVLNTSFNVDSEPIVCTPKNALATFYMSGMDALAIGDFVVEKDRLRDRS